MPRTSSSSSSCSATNSLKRERLTQPSRSPSAISVSIDSLSCSVIRLCYPHTDPLTPLDQAAVARGVRPGVETAGAIGALGHPHLLERRPAVRPAAPQELSRRVRAHKTAIHLQAAPVRVAQVAPASLEAVDAEPGALVRRMGREPHRPAGLAPPVEVAPRAGQRDARL